MSAEFELVCPVCRAKQKMQPTCRRCSADLALYALAIGSLNAVKQQWVLACESGNRELAARSESYWNWLHPRTAAQWREEAQASALVEPSGGQ